MATGDSARTILQRFADAWRGREELALDGDLIVAFRIRGEGGGDYHVTLSQKPGATVRDGVVDAYDLRFEAGMDVLRRLDRGDLNALTAMGQAQAGDAIPLVPAFGAEFAGRPDASLIFRRLAFHFWTRDWPEVVRFGESTTRVVHGGNATVLLYDDRFRSAWFQLKAGTHINADPGDQTNDFPQLVVVTRGRVKARLAGQDRTLAEGQAAFIPAGMTHEFWAEAGDYGECLWIAFGEGA
jgi:mannose-6-phosphate isomerase-like protein (cupin superfamily)